MFFPKHLTPFTHRPPFTVMLHWMAALLLITPFTLPPNVIYRVRQMTDINQTPVTIEGQAMGTASSSPSHPIEMAGKLFFTADDGIHGTELWSSDGRPAGTNLLLDIAPGTEGSNPSGLTVFIGKLFFTANDGIHGTELWSSDGQPGGTNLLFDIAPGTEGSNPSALTILDQTLFFTTRSSDSSHTNLWKSDGTEVGTVLVTQMGTITSLTAIGGKLYLFDSAGLWVSDGTATGTVLLQYIPAPAFPPLEVNGVAYFVVWAIGYHLYTTDGTPAGTHFVRTIAGGSRSALAQQLVVNNRLFYVTGWREPFPFLHFTATSLWTSDGTFAGTLPVKHFVPTDNEHRQPLIGSVTAVGNMLYFAADDGAHGAELWKSDGTDAGTTLVADIAPGTTGSAPQQLAAMGDTLFFTANDGAHGTELWKSDGTAEGTTLVADIAPGVGNSYLEQITAAPIDGWIIFSASDGQSGTQLWMSNGTPDGTTRVGATTPGATALLPVWIGRGLGRIIVIADDGHTGSELWTVTAWRTIE